MIEIYTDGGCTANGYENSIGGFGVVLTINNKYVKMYKYGERNTTNNIMELKAVLYGIKLAKALNTTTPKEIKIYSDSSYVVNTINKWMFSWASNNWIKKSNNKPPENLNIIKELYDLMQYERNIKVEKVKGHSGVEFNEMADQLATAAIKEIEEAYFRDVTN